MTTSAFVLEGTVLESTVLEGIATVARNHLDWKGPVERGMNLVEDLELDSLRLFTLAAEVENHFRVRLDEGDEMELQTVGDLVDLVSRKLVPGLSEPEEACSPPL